jgi:hypothetical protein
MSAATGKTDTTSTVIAGGAAHTTPEKPAFLGEVGKGHTLRKSITKETHTLPTAEEIMKEKEELSGARPHHATEMRASEVPPSGKVLPGGK